MAHPNRLQNARVVVFGGTSGIGFGVANMALSNGAIVTISGSTQAKVDKKVKELQSLYPSLPASHVSGYAVDLADTTNLETNLKAFFDKVTENGAKKIDHIAFTAGDLLTFPKVSEVTPEVLMQAFTVRYIGISLIAKLVFNNEYMPRSTSSSITLTSGTNATKPSPGFTFVSAVGAAMEGLTRGLAVDMKPIRVNIVSPGAIQTELLQKVIDATNPKVEESMKAATLLGTIGQVQDTAEAYGYFMRDRFVTGSKVDTDGGRLLA